MQALAELDTVAYVRFASVYRSSRTGRFHERFVSELTPSRPAATRTSRWRGRAKSG